MFPLQVARVTIDKTAPTLTSVAIESDNANTAYAKAGDGYYVNHNRR